MDRNVAGLIGAVTTLAAAAPSHAVTPARLTADAVMRVSSYADLLKPIPNALALMEEVSAKEASAEVAMARSAAAASGDEARLLEAQYYPPHYHHHHHHHHHYHGYYGERFFGYPPYST